MTSPTGPRTGRAARPTDENSVMRRAQLEAWQRGLTDQVVGNILYYRDMRGLSNERLRERLSTLGWDLTKDSLASVLSGSAKRKTMPVGDVLLFAMALNVPPIALVFPIRTNRDVAIAPISVNNNAEIPPANAVDAAEWFGGRLAMRVPDHFDEQMDLVDEFYDVGDVISRVRDHENDLWRFHLLNAALVAEDYDNDEQKSALLRSARGLIDEIANARRYIRLGSPDLKLPSLRPQLQFVDDGSRTVPSLPLVGYSTPEELARVHELKALGESAT